MKRANIHKQRGLRDSREKNFATATIETRLSWQANAGESLFIFAFHGVERLPSGRGTKRRSRWNENATVSPWWKRET